MSTTVKDITLIRKVTLIQWGKDKNWFSSLTSIQAEGYFAPPTQPHGVLNFLRIPQIFSTTSYGQTHSWTLLASNHKLTSPT